MIEFSLDENNYRISNELNEDEYLFAKVYDIFNELILISIYDCQTTNVPNENILGVGTKLEVFCEDCKEWVDYFQDYIQSSLNRCCIKCYKSL